MTSIKVAVRCRPLFPNERAATGLDIQSRRILLDSKTYDPDYTFTPSSTQDDIFAACSPILQCVKDGLNGTIMVYGQTGTGKTYTMLGGENQDNGVVHKILAHMLEHVQEKTIDGAQCALTLSMIEIYNEKLTDMLSPNGDEEVTLISGFPRFTNKVTVCRMSDANEAIARGLAWRHTATTMMNERSSRSHVVFIVDVEEYNAYTEQTEVAHLFLVDLAGSESLKKSQAVGSTANEAGKINKSLLALKSVFLALSNTNEATRPTHVPYRDSKLTELLQDSIGGTARTLMIACVSAVGRDIEETKSTLMYAVKAKSIRNAANTEKEKLLIRLRSIEVENQRLRNRLQERVNEKGGFYVTKEDHERNLQIEQECLELKDAVNQLVQDRQNSDAKKHISESHEKILQGLLEEKDEKLNEFKSLYENALTDFECQSKCLQSIVQKAVLDATKALETFFFSSNETVECWERKMNQALSGDAVAGVTVEDAPVVKPQPSQMVHVSSPIKLIPANPSASQGNSPGKSGRSPRRARSARRGISPTVPDETVSRASSSQALVRKLDMNPFEEVNPKRETLTNFRFGEVFKDVEEQCCTLVENCNAVFKEILEQWSKSFTEFDDALIAVEDKRQERLKSDCDELLRFTKAGIETILRSNASATREVEHVRGLYANRIETHQRSFVPRTAEPFKNLIGTACRSAVSSATEHLDSTRHPPQQLHDALNNISNHYQSKLNCFVAQSLLPLSSIESPNLSQNASPKYTMLPSNFTISNLPDHGTSLSQVSQPRKDSGACYSAPLNIGGGRVGAGGSTGLTSRSNNNSLKRSSLSARNSNVPGVTDSKKRTRSVQSCNNGQENKKKK